MGRPFQKQAFPQRRKQAGFISLRGAFVGGYPDEYCIYLSDLTDEEKRMITDLGGNPADLADEPEWLNSEEAKKERPQ